MTALTTAYETLGSCPACKLDLKMRVTYEVEPEPLRGSDGTVTAKLIPCGMQVAHDCNSKHPRGPVGGDVARGDR